MLRGGARQKVRGIVDACDGPALYKGREADLNLFGSLQRLIGGGRGHHEHVAEIGRSRFAPQAFVEFLQVQRRRVQAGEALRPKAIVVDQNDGQRSYSQQRGQPLEPTHLQAYAGHLSAQPMDAGVRHGARRKHGQHEAGDRRRRQQTRDRIHPELCQTGKAGEEQRRKAADRRGHAQANGRPVFAPPVGVVARLHKVVDAVVQCFAQQGCAKSYGDGVHGAKAQRHRHHGHHDARQHRDQADDHVARRPIEGQHDREDGQPADQREALDLGADGATRIDREDGRARHQQAHVGALARRVKSRADACQHLLLRVGICPGRRRHRHQQGDVARGGRPHAVL